MTVTETTFITKLGAQRYFDLKILRAHINRRGDGRSNEMVIAGIILCMRPGSDEQVCIVTSSFAGRADARDDPSHHLSWLLADL